MSEESNIKFMLKTRRPRMVWAFFSGILYLSIMANVLIYGDGRLGGGTIVALLVLFIFNTILILDEKLSVTPRVAIVLISSYIALCICDAAIYLLSAFREQRVSLGGMHGLYVHDSTNGFHYAPNWKGVIDDGKVKFSFKTNSRGHRDGPPGGPRSHEILLIGDSFVFGALLDEEDTIDRQIERKFDGKIKVYNLGTGGYGPASSLENLRRNVHLAKRHVYYLFYMNDLSNREIRKDNGVRVVNGHSVSNFNDELNREISETQIESDMKALLARKRNPFLALIRHGLFKVIALRNLRDFLGQMNEKEKPGDSLLDGPSHWYQVSNVRNALQYTQKMQSVARDHNLSFTVVIVPSFGEAIHGIHADIVNLYIGNIADSGIQMLDLIEEVSKQDYYAHDGHFNSSGAKKAAFAIASDVRRKRKINN